MNDPESKSDPQVAMNDPRGEPNPGSPKSPATALQTMLDALWDSSKDTIVERVSAVREAYRMASTGTLDSATAQLGAQEAHKLAGVLGTFGLPRGSEVSRQAEELLDRFPTLSAAEISQLGVWLAELDAMIASRHPTQL